MSIWQKMLCSIQSLDRPSLTEALADYLLDINHNGYQPNPNRVIAIRGTDRTAWLRNAEIPVRWERYYYIEGELFPTEGQTKIPPERTVEEHAEILVSQIWDDISLWSGFDFTPTSYGLNHMLEPVQKIKADTGDQNAG